MSIETIAGRYEVTGRIGSGGMGDVWVADDTLLGRQVALKFVSQQGLRQNPGADAILRDEARNAGQLIGHPNTLSVLDLIDVNTALHKGPAVVMEFIEGCTAKDWIVEHRPALDELTQLYTSLYIGSEILEAIGEAHRRDILHRDIKPQNVLISTLGRTKVADFGLSRIVEAITRSHTVWAHHTPQYSAPEQWAEEHPDYWTDVYQLCATLYELLTGTVANRGTGMLGLARWHETGQLQPIAELAPAVDPTLAELIESGLSKKRDDRPQLWRLFDAIAKALPSGPVRMKIETDENLSDDEIKRIAVFTDFDADKLRSAGSFGPILFPQPLEAIRECIGTTLLGGKATIST